VPPSPKRKSRTIPGRGQGTEDAHSPGGYKNWLHIGGDGGLARAAVLLSLAASAKQHHVNPWEYVKDLLTEIPTRAPNADLSDPLPDARAKAHPAT